MGIKDLSNERNSSLAFDTRREQSWNRLTAWKNTLRITEKTGKVFKLANTLENNFSQTSLFLQTYSTQSVRKMLKWVSWVFSFYEYEIKQVTSWPIAY